jgi:hypothetical protein
MNPLLHEHDLTYDLTNRIHDLAKRHAEALRREARDDVWRGADALLTDAAGRALRSAERLACRLRRRLEARRAATVGLC